MTRAQLFAAMEDAGHRPTVRLLEYALKTGKVDPPPVDPYGNRIYGRVQAIQLEKYLRTPNRRGRPRTVSVSTSTTATH